MKQTIEEITIKLSGLEYRALQALAAFYREHSVSRVAQHALPLATEFNDMETKAAVRKISEELSSATGKF